MTRWWWWTGMYGSVKRHRQELEAAASPTPGNVALVVGSTGVVGEALLDILPSKDVPAGPWKVYAVSHRTLLPLSSDASSPTTSSSSSSFSNSNPVVHLRLDLADPAAVDDVLAPITDITHVFYVSWSPCSGSTREREANCDMLRNVLSVVIPNCTALVHVCLQTARRNMIDPFEPLVRVPTFMRPYSEDLPRPYPDLEDVLLDGLVSSRPDGAAITWSVHRTNTVFGFSPRSARNVVANLCVYGAICCKEKATMRWPGSHVAWEGFSEASDAELVAEHALWAAVEPSAKNKAFNCLNGDVYKWKLLWAILANHFGVEYSGYDGEDKRYKLVEAMAGKEAVWAEIVRENGLVETQLDEVASWRLVDDVINADEEQLDTMNKNKEHGFLGFRNTVRSFDAWVRKMKTNRIVP